ncbi:MAG: PD-(D/E)XK nuclease family protein, partial [Myxococcales bacterium]|nr:PD-(D/E)XK nuclease family protein [Myxococcales bacterium]
VLSYALADAQGGAAAPSQFLLETAETLGYESLEAWRAASRRGDAELLDLGEIRRRAARRDALARALAEALAGDGVVEIAREIGRATGAIEPVAIADPGYRDSQGAAAEARGLSPTRLKVFNDCAYKHFARYVLGLDPRREEPPRLEDAGVQGTIAHRVLVALVEGAAKEIPALVLDAATIEMKRGEFTEEEHEILARIGADVARFAGAYPLWIEDPRWRPVGLECKLDALGDGPSPARLTVGGRAFSVEGRLDRVDLRVLPDGTRGVRILDYKYSTSGAAEYTVRKEIQKGIDLQLPLYLAVAAERLGAEPVAAIRAPLREGRMGGILDADDAAHWGLAPDVDSVCPKDTPLAEFLEETKARFAALAERIEAGEMLRRPRDPKTCEESRCAYRFLCRVQPWFERGRDAAEEGGDE